MTNEYQLINLYCVICQQYNSILIYDAQRTSNNYLPKFTDEECLTIYIWGLANRKFTCLDVYKFIKAYYSDWFPNLPKYKAFNKRICYLSEAIKTLAGELLSLLPSAPEVTAHLTDSMPIVVAKQSRSSRARVAPDMCSKGYCDSKKMYYYGVKLHVIGQCRHRKLPQPKQMLITGASVHDRKAAEDMLSDVYGIDLFADKAYINAGWEADIKKSNHIDVFTPVKLKKGQAHLGFADQLFSTAVSKVRQPIEAFFNWIQELTQIQNACKVRSRNGLTAFVFARIAFACFVLADVLSV